MSWMKVDDQFHSSDKLLSIPKRHRFQAAGLWTIAGSWVAGQQTDGFVPDYMIREWNPTRMTVESLVNAGLWERVRDGFVFCSWLKYNPSKEDSDSERAASKERMRSKREREKSKIAGSSVANENVTGEQPGVLRRNAQGVLQRPDPTRPDLKERGEKETADVTVEASPTPSPSPLDAPSGGSRASLGFAAYGTLDDPRCAKHKDLPRDQVPACRDCAHARQVLQERHEHEKQEARRLIDECPWCDERGIANLHDRLGRPVAVKCDHVHQPVPPPAPEGFKPLRTKRTQNTPKMPPSGPTEPRKDPDWYE